MTMKEVIETTKTNTREGDGRNIAVGLAVAGKLIADAMDRASEIQRKQMEGTQDLTKLYKQILPGMGKMVDNMNKDLNEGDEWKDQDSDDDGI